MDRDVLVGTIAIQIAPNGVCHHSKTRHVKIPTDTEEKNAMNHPKETTGTRPAAPAGQSSKYRRMIQIQR